MRAYVDTSVVRVRIAIAVASVCFGIGLLLSSSGFAGAKLIASLGVGGACILFGLFAVQKYARQHVYANLPVLEVSKAALRIRHRESKNTNEVRVPDVSFIEPRRKANGKLGYQYYVDIHMSGSIIIEILISDLSISPTDVFEHLQKFVPWRDEDGIATNLGRK